MSERALGSTRLLLLLACVSTSTACRDEPEQPPPRGLVDTEGQPLRPQRPVAPREEKPAQQEDPFANEPSAFDGPAAAQQGSETNSAEEPAAPTAAAEEEPKRDLSKELLALLPSPVDCLDLAQAVERGGKLTISVNAMVMPSGRISRASVSAPGQAAEAVRCLEQRVMAGSLADDVPGAPLSVRASMPLEIVGQKAPPAATRPAAQPAAPANEGTVAQPAPGDIAQPDGTELAQPSN